MADGLAQRLDRSLARLASRGLIPPLLLSVAWVQELVDQLLFAGRWNLPLLPHGPIWGLFTAPFSHSGFAHLISNSIWFLPLSWLVLLRGGRDYLAVWIAVLLMEVPLWLFWPVGAQGLSGVNYALLGYLLLIGWLERRPLTMLLSCGSLLAYGGLLPSLLPFLSPPGVSWIGHASGFLAGLLAALAVHRE